MYSIEKHQKKPKQKNNFLLQPFPQCFHSYLKLKTRQDFVTVSTLCYHGMFKYSKWKPALALLITRNALSEHPFKTWVLKSMPSRSHKACELFVLPVQPVCLRSSFRGRAKLSVLQRKGMCKKRGGGRVEEKLSFRGNGLWTSEHWYSVMITLP